MKTIEMTCACGATYRVRPCDAKRGHKKSCGCLTSKMKRDAVATHGQSGTPLYRTWSSMIARCENPTRKDYARYGGRGVTVCARWRESFAAFALDMGPKPAKSSLDRINGLNGYEPGNVRWADIETQNRNRRGVKLSMTDADRVRAMRADGSSFAEIGRRFGISARHAADVALGRYWTVQP